MNLFELQAELRHFAAESDWQPWGHSRSGAAHAWYSLMRARPCRLVHKAALSPVPGTAD
jgi:hypothetical protein